MTGQDNTGKQMPYVERDDYLDDLINKATEKAIECKSQKLHSSNHGILFYASISVAASLLLIAGWFWLNPRHETHIAQNVESPIDEFLDGLTDEEVMMLSYYEIEEIPEY